MKKVQINTEYITLGQFLKYIGMINFGSDAKNFLNTEEVLVDGILENRRGRKLYPQMTVKIKDNEYLVEN